MVSKTLPKVGSNVRVKLPDMGLGLIIGLGAKVALKSMFHVIVAAPTGPLTAATDSHAASHNTADLLIISAGPLPTVMLYS